jgi:hypothetical protein
LDASTQELREAGRRVGFRHLRTEALFELLPRESGVVYREVLLAENINFVLTLDTFSKMPSLIIATLYRSGASENFLLDLPIGFSKSRRPWPVCRRELIRNLIRGQV